MTLLVAADVLGRDMGTGKRLRALVLLRDAGPTLLTVAEDLSIEERPLTQIVRGGFRRVKDYTFHLADGSIVGLDPQNCSCGAGNIAYMDPTPGESRTAARMPEGLEVYP